MQLLSPSGKCVQGVWTDKNVDANTHTTISLCESGISHLWHMIPASWIWSPLHCVISAWNPRVPNLTGNPFCYAHDRLTLSLLRFWGIRLRQHSLGQKLPFRSTFCTILLASLCGSSTPVPLNTHVFFLSDKVCIHIFFTLSSGACC